MHIRQPISVGKLLLDLGNYRNPKQTSQKGARDAIISEQGRKLVVLARIRNWDSRRNSMLW